MKIRNYVAKYAQRSGAGKHKENKVQEYYRDDWNDADQQVIDYNEIQYMEDKIVDLEQQNKDLRDEEVFVLAEIMYIRDHYSDYDDVAEALGQLIALHDISVRYKARDKLMKMYPNRHWGEDTWQLG
jgi:hypothetical protein